VEASATSKVVPEVSNAIDADQQRINWRAVNYTVQWSTPECLTHAPSGFSAPAISQSQRVSRSHISVINITRCATTRSSNWHTTRHTSPGTSTCATGRPGARPPIGHRSTQCPALHGAWLAWRLIPFSSAPPAAIKESFTSCWRFRMKSSSQNLADVSHKQVAKYSPPTWNMPVTDFQL